MAADKYNGVFMVNLSQPLQLITCGVEVRVFQEHYLTLSEGYRCGFPHIKVAKKCKKNLNTFYTSRWPAATSAPLPSAGRYFILEDVEVVVLI